MASALTILDGALLFAQAELIVERLEDAEVSTKKPNAPVPRGTITNQEAWTFFPLVMLLLQEKFPQLADPEALSELLQSAHTDSADGRPH